MEHLLEIINYALHDLDKAQEQSALPLVSSTKGENI